MTLTKFYPNGYRISYNIASSRVYMLRRFINYCFSLKDFFYITK